MLVAYYQESSIMNQAMLDKASWRIIHNDDGLCCSVLKHKYLKKRSLLTHNYKCPSGSSRIGRSTFCVWGSTMGVVWRVRDDTTINFWTNKWINEGVLMYHASVTSIVNQQLKVCSLWKDNGWDLEFLHNHFRPEIVHQITKILVGYVNSRHDKIIWGQISTRHFL